MPGHDDSTPSMLLHLDQGRYHCFGCGASGDVIQWVRDVYGVDTRTALAMLDAASGRFPDPPAGAVSTMRSEVGQQERSEQPDLDRTPEPRESAQRWRRPGATTRCRAWRRRPPPISQTAGSTSTKLGDVAGHTPYNPDQLVEPTSASAGSPTTSSSTPAWPAGETASRSPTRSSVAWCCPSETQTTR